MLRHIGKETDTNRSVYEYFNRNRKLPIFIDKLPGFLVVALGHIFAISVNNKKNILMVFKVPLNAFRS